MKNLTTDELKVQLKESDSRLSKVETVAQVDAELALQEKIVEELTARGEHLPD